MDIATRVQYKEKLALIVGDVLVISISLWLSTVLRNFAFPTYSEYVNFISPFLYIAPVWLLLFIIGGLYDGQTLVTKRKVPKTIAIIQSINIVVTVIYFYLFSSYRLAQATPKTILVLFAILSIGLLYLWRTYIYQFLSQGKRSGALLIASGQDLLDLKKEINGNSRYPFIFEKTIDADVVMQINKDEISKYDVVVIDSHHPKVKALLSSVYNELFLHKGKNYIDFVELYEEVFKRIPLSSLSYEWFLGNISVVEKKVYDSIKRVMDIILSLVLVIPLVLVYPFVVWAIKMEDGGEPFISQTRVGERGRIISIKKFRSMTGSKENVWIGEEGALTVTRVGSFIRKTRIDELPQLISMLKGDISFVGPRPDLKGLSERLIEEIPYYQARYIVKPGLSGWAQVTQEGAPPQSVDETKLRLSYDLYYIKHRSIVLDITIVLKTIKTLSMRVGV
ncbi:MAG: sugar transferase [Patescibacteria group bacterium]